MVDIAAAYAETKAGLLAAVGPPGSPTWDTPVPATPEWNVLEVVAHVTGIAADAAGDAMPSDVNLLEQFRDADIAAARDAYADGQVLRRREMPPDDVIAEWDAAERTLLDRLRRPAGAEGALPFGSDVIVVTDLCVHAEDVAMAIGHPPNRGSAASRVAVAGYCFGVDYRIRALGLPALGLRYDGREKTLGEGPVGATLAADRWELLRVLAGRRSRAQIVGLDWSGDPEPYLPLLPAYGEWTTDLLE